MARDGAKKFLNEAVTIAFVEQATVRRVVLFTLLSACEAEA